MRERLAVVLLALLLSAGFARAQEATPEDAAEDEAAVAEDEAEGGERAAPKHAAWVPGYQELQGHGENSPPEGDLRVSVNAGLRPSRGYVPLQVSLNNLGVTPRLVRIGVESNGVGRAEVASRQVEVGPRQRLTVWLPVPIAARGGTVRVQSPGFGVRGLSFYSVDPVGQPVLVLGTERAFQSGTRLPRVEDKPKLSVRFVAPEDAPRELAAYVGHAMVVVAGDVTALPADAWSALEAYASTGGHLVLLRPPRDVESRLPLLSGSMSGGAHPYGFGRVRMCIGPQTCGASLLSDAAAMEKATQESVVDVGLGGKVGIVTPIGPPPNWQRSSYMLAGGEQPLLPGVQAPVGRFLLLITLFVLAVGPGGLALARRRGPVALLIAVPSVAFVTCLAIVAWSVLVEGFSIHASRYSLVWLDRARDRALVVGVSGYYANLEPEGLHIPALGALLGPDVDWESQAVEADWTNGMVVTGGFLPSRTYREWGELAVVPTRARLTVRRQGQTLRVQNALGAPLTAGYVQFGRTLWTLPALADGAEGEASPVASANAPPDFKELVSFPELARRRFNVVPWNVLGQSLPEGDFIAKLEGLGLAPSAALPVDLHEGVHFIRGRVDGP